MVTSYSKRLNNVARKVFSLMLKPKELTRFTAEMSHDHLIPTKTLLNHQRNNKQLLKT